MKTELSPNQVMAVEWIDAQLQKPNNKFYLGGGVYVNDLHECLATQKDRIVFGCETVQRASFRTTKKIKDYLLKNQGNNEAETIK
jgi:hypothetical protein